MLVGGFLARLLLLPPHGKQGERPAAAALPAPKPPFSWKRELPCILLAAGATLAARAPAVLHADALARDDPAVAGLMALHIWRDGATPVFFYGQDSIGLWEAYWAAPFSWALGGHPMGLALSQAVALALAMLAFYRLFFRIGGGRAGALAGCLVLAVGTPYQIEYTASAGLSYLSTLYLGAVLLWVGPAVFEKPGPWRLFGLGVLLGLGWWNNPIVVSFAGAVLLGAWYRGRLVSLRGAAAPPIRRLLVWVVLAAAAAVVASLLLLLVTGPQGGRVLGLSISLRRPEKYLLRAGAALAAALVLAELALAADRRRWIALAACLAAGATVGGSPILVHRLRGPATKRLPMLQRDPDLRENARQLAHTTREMLLGAGFKTEDLPGVRGTLYAAWRRFAVAVAGLALLALILRHGRELAGLATFRPTALSPPVLVVLVPSLLLWGSCLLRGGIDVRHLLLGWLPLSALVAWMAGGLWARRPALSVLLVAVLLAGQAIAIVQFSTYDLPRMDRPEERRAIEGLVADGATAGYASVEPAHPLTLLSGERLRVGVLTHIDRIPRYTEEARRTARPFQVFDHRAAGDPGREARFLERHAEAVDTRWRFGSLRIYRYRQTEPAPHED